MTVKRERTKPKNKNSIKFIYEFHQEMSIMSKSTSSSEQSVFIVSGVDFLNLTKMVYFNGKWYFIFSFIHLVEIRELCALCLRKVCAKKKKKKWLFMVNWVGGITGVSFQHRIHTTYYYLFIRGWEWMSHHR